MDKRLSNSVYEIAHINDSEANAIKKVENLLKEETGKDFILIAWQKEETIN